MAGMDRVIEGATWVLAAFLLAVGSWWAVRLVGRLVLLWWR